MKCPNYLICNGNENSYNDVCHMCDLSKIGFFDKERDLLGFNLAPSIYKHPESFSEYESRKLDKDTRDNLLSKLYNNRNNTGILTIEKISAECPICFENKDIFVKHPTCNIHSICDLCFKETFFIKEVIYPEEPTCYKIFTSFLEENEITDLENKYYNNHQQGSYNCYCDYPEDEWPTNIKEIYYICSDYDRKYFDCMLEEDRRETEAINLKKCPICRECKLHI